MLQLPQKTTQIHQNLRHQFALEMVCHPEENKAYFYIIFVRAYREGEQETGTTAMYGRIKILNKLLYTSMLHQRFNVWGAL
jgi:hypothetical protein